MKPKVYLVLMSLVAVLLAGGAATLPATAQQQQEGLVNVAVGDISTGDIVSNNTVNVDVAANIAANVCGVNVNAAVISEQIARTGSYRCEGATQFVRVTQQGK